MIPGTELGHDDDDANLTLDLADDIFDLQVALGFDTDYDSAGSGVGSFDDDADALGVDDVFYEGTTDNARATDDWLGNSSTDNPAAAQYRVNAAIPARPVRLYYVRISTLGADGASRSEVRSPRLRPGRRARISSKTTTTTPPRRTSSSRASTASSATVCCRPWSTCATSEPLMRPRHAMTTQPAAPDSRPDHRRAEAGSAYLAILLVLVVLTILGLSLAVITQTEVLIGGSEKQATRQLFAAGSGVELAAAHEMVSARLRQSPHADRAAHQNVLGATTVIADDICIVALHADCTPASATSAR